MVILSPTAELLGEVTPQERALTAELAGLDRRDVEAEWGALVRDGFEGCYGPDVFGSEFSSDEAAQFDEGDEAADTVDDALADVGAGGAHPADLLVLAAIAAESLDHLGRLEYLAAIDKVVALAAWLRSQALLAVAGSRASSSSMDEVHVEHEVAVARRTSTYAAGRAIEDARFLATAFAGFAEALRVGEVSEAHVSVLVERTRHVVDAEVLARIEGRVLPKAKRLPAGRFGHEVAKAVVALDPDTAARHRRARERREVWVRPLDDGLGQLGLVHDWATVSAIAKTLEADAAVLRTQRGGAAAVVGGDEEARMGACRADALAARVLGAVGDDGSVTFDRDSVAVELSLVIDLETLRGEVDRLALLDGQPLPAEVGRELSWLARSWRRCITDPVTGALLDFGSRQYRAEPLRRFVLARDGECRSPVCAVSSSRRLELDHALEFPAGPTSAANGGAVCGTCHQLKTSRHVRISDSAADGSCTWVTAWGQQVRIPPRAFLHEPEPPDG